ncbi:APC family permease [Ktedonosporobacter rubrisoli]|uniref:APC family permease n=1 Tax=Ktedonosporobacter rubrisoli TaxID=2509675 RepID=A0A4P6JXB5_KTERU|nr:APC family permease [Ktedonosporobacter rubrisoli]QBD80165.1 APC family permease [Ktedonosporobacter rubrisoli]
MSDISSPPPADMGALATTTSPPLRSNALGLPHAIVISVAVMSPAASIFFNTIPQAGLVGAAIPFCFVIGFIAALLVANQYSEMSRELPSSGSAYTFVVEALGPRWGFLCGWIGLIAVGLGAPYSFVLMSANLQELLWRWFGLNLHWSFWFVLAIGVVFALCYIGIRQSLSVDLTFLLFEIGICLLLAVIVLWRVGNQGGLSATPFNPAVVPRGGDLTVGIVLAVLSFIGFETAATLGEETRDPHRNIPRAVYGSMLVVGIFFVFMVYAATIGYGVDKMATGYANDPAPFDTIARHFGGDGFAALIDIVGLLSFFGAALAIVNGGARIIYTIGRDGLLPPWLAWTHPQRQTPVNSIILLCVTGIIIGIGLGLAFTPIGAFGFLGTLDAMFVILIYVLVNISCIRFFWLKRRERFNLLRHAVVPLLSTTIYAVIFLTAILSPGTGPLSLVPYVVGVWLALGLGLLFVLRRKIV